MGLAIGHESDLSDEDDMHDEMLLEEEGGGDTSRRGRILWTNEKEDYLIRVYNHYRRQYSGGHGLKARSWKCIGVHMTRRYQEEFDSKSCRNKFNVLKYDYDEMKRMDEARLTGNPHIALSLDMLLCLFLGVWTGIRAGCH